MKNNNFFSLQISTHLDNLIIGHFHGETMQGGNSIEINCNDSFSLVNFFQVEMAYSRCQFHFDKKFHAYRIQNLVMAFSSEKKKKHTESEQDVRFWLWFWPSVNLKQSKSVQIQRLKKWTTRLTVRKRFITCCCVWHTRTS